MSETPPNDWLEKESHGSAELAALLKRQDDLFARAAETGGSGYRDEANQLEMEKLQTQIAALQARLGIDPLEGPEYPKSV